MGLSLTPRQYLLTPLECYALDVESVRLRLDLDRQTQYYLRFLLQIRQAAVSADARFAVLSGLQQQGTALTTCQYTYKLMSCPQVLRQPPRRLKSHRWHRRKYSRRAFNKPLPPPRCSRKDWLVLPAFNLHRRQEHWLSDLVRSSRCIRCYAAQLTRGAGAAGSSLDMRKAAALANAQSSSVVIPLSATTATASSSTVPQRPNSSGVTVATGAQTGGASARGSQLLQTVLAAAKASQVGPARNGCHVTYVLGILIFITDRRTWL